MNKPGIDLCVGLDVFVASASGDMLSKGTIDDITSSWSGLRVIVNGQTFCLPKERFGAPGFRQDEESAVHIMPMSCYAEWANRTVKDWFSLLGLRFGYALRLLDSDTVTKIEQHLDSIAQLIDAAGISSDEHKRINSLIRMHGEKGLDRAAIAKLTHSEFIKQQHFTANSIKKRE